MVFALALVHHLAIANNIPLLNIIEFLSVICKQAIIEFVPKSDKQTQLLLASREDIFINYNEPYFEDCIKTKFEILAKHQIQDSARTLYFIKNKDCF